ncbi:MAG TPA: DUF3237 domain-containing protein [Stellaceae bacterium]|nr:DUF3237 domain-containing protein [Stellaceae bacterium]
MFACRLEHVMSATAKLGTREVIGPVPEGFRINIHVASGEVAGPRISGKLLPLGGDWLTVRRDGMALLDVRLSIETNDGALIYVTYSGSVDWGEDGYDRVLRGEAVGAGQTIRISPKFLTSHTRYIWLNRLHCIGVGEAFRERAEIAYDIYAVG